MTEGEDIDGLAAEYVLGSLDVDERRRIAVRRKVDAALDDAIRAWETRLAPLGDDVPGTEPPPYLFRRIADTLWAPEGTSVQPTQTRFSSRRALLVGACALAACLALVVVWLHGLPGRPTTFSAQLQRSALGTILEDSANVWTPFGFEVSFDLRASTIVVNPVAAGASSTRHYQLWLIPRDHGPPISLGVIALPKTNVSPWLATYPPGDLPDTKLAVSLEPEGGSPIGIPSGPLVFVGTLSPAMP
jgi:anti-sigma-K factor RskA